MSHEIAGFSKLSKVEKIEWIAKQYFSQPEEAISLVKNYWNTDEKGTYYCASCGNKLFRSGAKCASSCGWPSFFEQSSKKSIVFKEDNSIGMERIETLCGRCGGHLGHVFEGEFLTPKNIM